MLFLPIKHSFLIVSIDFLPNGRNFTLSDPIIPWVGGKRRLAKHLLPLFPQHKCYVEPFCGGASLFFTKKASQVEIIDDINGKLINLYRVVKNHL